MKTKLTIFYLIIVRLAADIPMFWMIYLLYRPKEGSGGLDSALINLALFAGFAIPHSILTRKFVRDLIAKIAGADYVRSFFVLTSGITLALMLYFWQPVSGELWRMDGIYFWIVSAMFFALIAVVVTTTVFIDYSDFLGIKSIWRRMKNIPQKQQSFSVRGLYAYCRHPMYFFFLIAFWVTPVMNYSRLEFAVLGSIYFLIGTLHEEKNLREELGNIYDVYRENVPMWIPRLKAWKMNK